MKLRPMTAMQRIGFLLFSLTSNLVSGKRRAGVQTHRVEFTFLSPDVRASIQDNMTLSKAVAILKKTDDAPPALLKFVEKRFGHDANTTEKADPGYGGLAAATNMLNDMISTASTKKDIETVRCDEYHKTQTKLIEESRQAIAKFDAEAAAAREEILRADAAIDMITGRLEELHDKLTMNNRMCEEAIPNLEEQLRIVTGDLVVMAKVLEKTACDAASASLLQTDTAVGLSLVKCNHKITGRSFVTFSEHGMRQAVSKLRSQYARLALDSGFRQLYEEAVSNTPLVTVDGAGGGAESVNGQYYAKKPLNGKGRFENENGAVIRWETGANEWEFGYRSLGTENKPKWTIQGSGRFRFYNELDTPEPPTQGWISRGAEYANGSLIIIVASDPAALEKQRKKCSLRKNPNCGKLRDKFLNVQAGIDDKRRDLEEELAALQTGCEDTREKLESQIKFFEVRLKEEQEALATATKHEDEATEQSRQKTEEKEDQEKEYGETMEACEITITNLEGELCGLGKIRSDLEKMEGDGNAAFIQDCKVSVWTEDECSATCGGGTQVLTRTILTHPFKGAACGPLKMEKPCNEDECPVNCELADWSGWSSCSAECGGGVKERTRDVVVEEAHGGEACGETTESEECNVAACDKDCVLADWSDWGACSKACDHGTKESMRFVAEESTGSGFCAADDSEARLRRESCNEQRCERLLGMPTMLCESKVDIVLLLDGSGSLAEEGWATTVEFAQEFAHAMRGMDGNGVELATILFSGPISWPLYKACTDDTFNTSEMDFDQKRDCQVDVVNHFTNDTESVVNGIKGMTWPKGTTLTSMALAMAEGELKNGRSDAQAVVIVVTDGKPMSPKSVTSAVKALRKKARLIWVPVTTLAPLADIKHWASEPWEENVVAVENFPQLSAAITIDKIIADACPEVGR